MMADTKEKERDQAAHAQAAQRQADRDTRPSGATGPGAKGAQVMGAPGAPSGPNEIDDGDGGARIPPDRPIPPGEEQVGLAGGGGISGSGNVEPPPYPPDADTYPPMLDTTLTPEAQKAKLRERDDKVLEDREKRLKGQTEGQDDKIGYTESEAERLKEESKKAGEEQRERDKEALDAQAESGPKDRGRKSDR